MIIKNWIINILQYIINSIESEEDKTLPEDYFKDIIIKLQQLSKCQKMKIRILLLCICVLFVSCVDKYKCINNIQAEFPYGEVHHIEETPYFLVFDSIGVYIVSCNTPFSYDVYSKTLIKKWK